MIFTYKEIISETPLRQIWKLLRYYRDAEAVESYIRSIHGIAPGIHAENVKKQARQIGFCVTQAEEYFSAAAGVGIATKPVMLYYGIVSLSQALVLLRLNGENSLDARRSSRKHKHHGLDLIGKFEGLALRGDLECALSSIRCECHRNSSNNLWGQFPLFYSALVSPAFAVQVDIHDEGEGTYLTKREILACSEFRAVDQVAKSTIDLLSLIKAMPDMFGTLSELGLQPDLCGGNTTAKAIRFYTAAQNGPRTLSHTVENHRFFIDGILPDQKEHLLAFYKGKNPDVQIEADFGANVHLVVQRNIKAGETHRWYYPDIVDDLNSAKYFILKPDNYLSEPASYFVVAYSLSMLARYYPDVWIKAISANVKLAELIDELLSIIQRKYPNLILDQLSWTKHYVHI